MPALRSSEEARRALKLLVGLERTPAAEIMRRHGFGEAERQEGWRCLHAVAVPQLLRAAPPPEVRLLERLDAWESVWFPAASEALRERFPAVHAWLFRDLPGDRGEGLVTSIGTFLQRLLRMPFEPALGAHGADARELLARRGIDVSTVRIASELLELVCTAQDREPGADPNAEAALRSWYLRWSEVARLAITDREVLRTLGCG